MSDDVIDFGMTERQFHKALFRAEEDGVLVVSGLHMIEDATQEEVERGSAVVATVEYNPRKKGVTADEKKWVKLTGGFEISSDREMAQYKGKPLGLTKSHVRILERILRENTKVVVPFSDLADVAKVAHNPKNISSYVSKVNARIKEVANNKKMENYLKSKRGVGYYRE